MVSYPTIILTYQSGKSSVFLIFFKIFSISIRRWTFWVWEPLEALWFPQKNRQDCIWELSESRWRPICQTRLLKFGYFVY